MVEFNEQSLQSIHTPEEEDYMDRDSLKLSLFATMLHHNQDIPAAIQNTKIVLETLFNDPVTVDPISIIPYKT